MLTVLKLYALASLLFSAGWAFIGWRWSKRREAELEPIQPIVRTWQ